MKVEGKDIFTVRSINSGKPKIKPECDKAIKQILELMKLHSITKISVN